MNIDIDQLKESEKRHEAIEKVGTGRDTKGLSDEASISVKDEVVKGNVLGSEDNLRKRKRMLETEAKEPTEFAFERAIGRNDSVYSNFVELIIDAKRKVGRISCKEGIREVGCATGFMVSEQLMLTNWHVFKTKEDVADSEIHFLYELDRFGNPGRSLQFKLRPDIFYHSNKELDYCFVAVEKIDLTATVSLKEIGYLYLDPGLGKVGDEGEEYLNIIHHPNGDYKQLSIRENQFLKITKTSIWYECDTAPGSSGSPVLNDQWQVVALHHMGVGKKNDNGQYIDKNGKVIPVINGRIDETKIVWEANEGIRTSVVLKDLFDKFANDPIVAGIKLKPGVSVAALVNDEKNVLAGGLYQSKEIPSKISPDHVNISIPSYLVEKLPNLYVEVGRSGRMLSDGNVVKSDAVEVDFFEIKKLEEAQDFTGFKGYTSKFLGVDIPIPAPKKSMQKFIAKVNGSDGTILKYQHFSVIFHSVRMQPVISAINVDGDLAKRLDETERKDVWQRDTRLDFDIQLDDKYYSNSGFDKGHMARREDANWGASAEIAKENADLTCMYTNACPQVAAINRSSKKGLWGKLEKIVLESGAIKEGRRTRKISVFNGPIFKDDDPVFKGIQIPMEFFKVVLWLTDDGDLKATAFKLSQEELVGQIDFEQLDLDQNIEFKEFQCSIASLEDETGLDFSGVKKFDTFKGKKTKEVTEEEVVRMVSSKR